MKRTLVGLGICLVFGALAQEQQPPDPPSRVARLSYMDGTVSYRSATAEEWAPATLNYPLTTGDSLWTADTSYAEVQIGAATFHLAPQTAFAVSFLDDEAAQISVTQGALYVRVPVLAKDEVVEIDTPQCAVTLLQAGSYRIDIDPANSTASVRVRTGEAEVAAGGRTVKARPGTMLQVMDNQQISEGPAAAPDGWEESCASRDGQADRYLQVSQSYLPAEIDGAADLAQYGEWSTDAEFGAVWSPEGVAADWEPYLYGQWAYVSPWGWTWIDDAPWGFAPFHYGRWIFARGHWLWVPDRNPIYAPALVTFVGGSGLHEGLPRRGPMVGWIPLGPGEFYRPQHPASDRYLRRVNGSAYRNNGPIQPGALRNHQYTIVTPQDTLTGTQRVASRAVRVPREAARGAETINMKDIRPLPQVRAGQPSNQVRRVAAPPPETQSRRVVARHDSPRSGQAAPPVVVVPPGRANGPTERLVRPPSAPAERRTEPDRRVGVPAPVEQLRTERPLPRPQGDDPRGRTAQPVDARRLEQQRIEQDAARAEQQRQEQQQAEQRRSDQLRLERQRDEQQRADQLRSEQQRTEQQRTEQQRVEQQRAEQQRNELQRMERQRAEQQRADQMRLEQQRAEQQRAEQLRIEHQRTEQQRAEQMRMEQQRAEQQRAEQMRADQMRMEQQHTQQMRMEQQRAEQQHAEQQRMEQQRAEQQRAEQMRMQQQRAEQQHAEQQQAAERQRQADDAKKAEEQRKKQQQ